MTERLAYSPKEFAALFGKEQTWAYRLIYAEKIKIISQFGNKLIPASEVNRVLNSADLHDEEKKSTRGRKKSRIAKKQKRGWVNHLKHGRSSHRLLEASSGFPYQGKKSRCNQSPFGSRQR